jgi:asparagine N-glycosylation enzyme membrane subunit Stt3
VDFIINQLLSPAQKSLVHQTVSEQNPMATNISEFVNDGYQRYGIALLYGLLMIPVLAYFAISRGSVGSLFVLTWSLPMMWGAYNKSAYIFTSSAPVTALGATIALLAAVKKEDLEGLRIIGTILVVCIPIFYVPMLGLTMYNKFVGYVVMHMGPTSDIYYWQPALEWHRDHTNPGDAVLTWWDYGHWFTAVSHRPVLIDNLQADYYEIQDVARFFVNKTTEEDAFETVKAYNSAYKAYNQSWGLNYATIDWTMIGKGSALHYIATGSIENASGGSWKNYIQCDFDPDNSQLDEKLVVSGNGSFSKVRKVMYNCQGEIYLVFTVEGYDLKETTVMTRYGNAIPWSTWMKSNDASILGVEPLLGLYERGVPSILACAINYRELPGGSVCRLPQFNTLIYVPQEFQDFMMTRLYLGKYMKEYRELGLYNREPTPLKHFREVPDYNGDGRSDGEFSFGFVRSYEISYEGFNATQTSVKDANGTAASESG